MLLELRDGTLNPGLPNHPNNGDGSKPACSLSPTRWPRASLAPRRWLRALLDPQTRRALGLIHGAPAEAWTVEGPAIRVAMSRSAFAARFSALVGEPPLTYLTR